MTRRVIGSTCAAALLSMSVAAAQVQSQQPSQAPVQGNSQQTPTERGQSDAQPGPAAATTPNSKDITVTGCVMREGTSDYVLSSAATPGGSANVAGGVSGSTSGAAIGTSGSTSTSPKSNRYLLNGGGNLSTYVGQRVEVMGHVDTTGTVGTSGATSAGTAASPGAGITASAGASDRDRAAGVSGSAHADAPQRFVVTSVKATTGACP